MKYGRYRALVILSIVTAVLVYIAVVNGRKAFEREITLEAAVDSVPAVKKEEPDFEGVVAKRSSFFETMLSCGLNPQEIHLIEKATKKVYDLRRIYPGQAYELFTDPEGKLKKLKFSINDEYYLLVERDSVGFHAEKVQYPYETRIKRASGMIEQSLFASLEKQNLPVELGLQISDIFAWDIDFFTDIRKNDYYRVIYEEKVREDGLTKVGRILAAEFNNQGKSHYAFLFENENGLADYYDENGKSLRKQLLRAPLTYTRISSSFSRRRYHPVLHHYAPHLGIDYAAPAGTPVMATGDGVVITASRTRANGNYIKIKHNSAYITYYLHLSRFARGIRKGVHVKQGQVIGYVGATGYATGPHLDYRVKKNGRFVNPRNLKLPPAQPVHPEKREAFLALKDKRIEELNEIPIADWRTVHYASRPSEESETGDETEPAPASSTQ